MYICKWKQIICSKPKLRTYCSFKSNFIMENYLFLFNKKHRHAIAKLRTSAHNLEIERGRWCNKPVESRICIFCDAKHIECEKHFLIECEKYSDLRTDLIYLVKKLCPNFDLLDTDQKFNTLLQIDDSSFVQSIAKTIYLMFERRKQLEYDLSKDI